jgi:hypothetical protein
MAGCRYCADVQDRVIAPAPPDKRNIVLATSIAETSITIDGVRIVVDSGLARVPRYEPVVGLTNLTKLAPCSGASKGGCSPYSPCSPVKNGLRVAPCGSAPAAKRRRF